MSILQMKAANHWDALFPWRVPSTFQNVGRFLLWCVKYMKRQRNLEAMIGILANGDNHFIVEGPLPGRLDALALVRNWTVIRINGATPPGLEGWRIIPKAYRENLEWAVMTPGDGEPNPEVKQLLVELEARGITIRDAATAEW
jgi:hypothetical protein